MSFYSIPLFDGPQFNSNERIFLGLLWVLSLHNQKEAFFTQEHIQLVGNVQIYNRTTKKLCEKGIISFNVKGFGKYKHRYFSIIDPKTINLFKQSEKQYSDCRKRKYRSESVDHTHTLSLDFDSIFSAMNEVKNEISDHIFTDAEIRENAQSYLDKSQLYNVYKGKPTEAKLKAWLQNSIKYLQEKPKTNKTAEHKIDWEEAAERLPERLQRIRELEEKYDREYSEPVEADYQIIDELEDKNASA